MSSGKIVDVNADEWESEVLNSKVPVIVDFWHKNCIWCLRLNPVLEKAADEYKGKVKFVKLDLLAERQNLILGQSLGVMGTPTLKLFCKGREVGEIVGFRPKDRLIREIDNILENREDCLKKSTPFPKEIP